MVLDGLQSSTSRTASAGTGDFGQDRGTDKPNADHHVCVGEGSSAHQRWRCMCRGITDEEKQHLRQKLGALIDQEDAQVQPGCYLEYSV